MCGILGGNRTEWNYEKGIEAMQHRGPDGLKVVRTERFNMAFARLAIIDLSSNGMQPMFTEDENVGIVFNGEVYGYQKLRKQLMRRGYQFRSSSDTEVVLNAYIEWGDSFIYRIDGMFGIAIYDKRVQKVKLFRDRIGIKPLYYYYNGKDFAFASELKGIVTACDNVKFQLNNTAIFDYLNCLYIPEPKTMYQNVYKLPPAFGLVYNLKENRIEKKGTYWKLKINENQGKERKEEDLIEELRYLIKESIEEQMIADVPVGTFLSGGVDSSIVTYETNRVNTATETFSIGFTEKLYDELKYATYLSQMYQIPMNQQVFNKETFKELYHMLPQWYDEPFADNSAFPTYLVSKLAKEKVTVVLTGDGGDEVFGGYPRYTGYKKDWYYKGINNKIVSRIFEQMSSGKLLQGLDTIFMEDLALLMPTYQYAVRPDKARLRKELGIAKDYDEYWFMRKHYNKELPPITRCQYLDLKTYLPGDILTKVDRTSMATSLETRVPLLSKKIVEFSFGLSEEDRCPKNELKGLLKKAYLQEIGRMLLYRNKKGFSIPTRYMKQGQAPQEQLLHEFWNI